MVKRKALSGLESTSASEGKSLKSKKHRVNDSTSTDSLKKAKTSEDYMSKSAELESFCNTQTTSDVAKYEQHVSSPEYLPVTGTWGIFVPKQARLAIDAIIQASDDPIRTTVFASSYAELMEAKSNLYSSLRDHGIERWSSNAAVEDVQKQYEYANIFASVYGGGQMLFYGDDIAEMAKLTDVYSQGWRACGHYETIALAYTEIADKHADLMMAMKVIDAAFDMRA